MGSAEVPDPRLSSLGAREASRSFTKPATLVPSPDVQTELIWGVAWALVVLKIPQIILACSQGWEALSQTQTVWFLCLQHLSSRTNGISGCPTKLWCFHKGYWPPRTRRDSEDQGIRLCSTTAAWKQGIRGLLLQSGGIHCSHHIA